MKKYFKRLIFLLFAIQTPLLLAFNPAVSVKAEFEAEKMPYLDLGGSSYDSDSKKTMLKQKLTRISNESKSFIEKQDDIYNPALSSYFVDYYEYSDNQLICPPLKDKFKTRYFTMIKRIDFRKGRVTCSVHENKRERGDLLLPKLNTVETKTYNNNYYDKTLNSNIDISTWLTEEAIEAGNLYKEKINNIKELTKYKYLKNNEDLDTKYLDKADILDALVVQDRTVINLKETSLQNKLVFNDGYVPFYLDYTFDEVGKENLAALYKLKKEINQEFSSSFDTKLFDDSDIEHKLLSVQNKELKGFEQFFLTIQK